MLKGWRGKLAKLFSFVALVILLGPNAALAIEPGIIKTFQTPFYDSADNICSSSDTTPALSSATASNTPIWNSGRQAPFYLEAFAVETLKDVASKLGTDNSNAVTQEHVVALVAWFWAEGGDIANQDLYNPLNTGLNDPRLLAGANDVSGVQSFKSFDAGVEATAITMTGPNQSRIGSALTNPSISAEQFMKVLAYYQNYAGNKAWAGADNPNKPDKTDPSINAQQGYYNNLLKNVEQARTNYAKEAGTIIGTPAHEGSEGITVDAGKLQFSGGDSSLASGNSIDCGGGISNGSIVQTAISLAWPSGDHGPSKADATTTYQTALPQYNPTTGDYSDCGGFVATVMRASQADTNYVGVYVPNQFNYVSQTAAAKYQIIRAVKDTSQLQPGDILMYVNHTNPADSHTFIYVGNQPGFSGDGAAASLGGHVPEAVSTIGSFNWDNRASTGDYMAVRIIK